MANKSRSLLVKGLDPLLLLSPSPAAAVVEAASAAAAAVLAPSHHHSRDTQAARQTSSAASCVRQSSPVSESDEACLQAADPIPGFMRGCHFARTPTRDSFQVTFLRLWTMLHSQPVLYRLLTTDSLPRSSYPALVLSHPCSFLSASLPFSHSFLSFS